jgi:glyoxylase-like metal-dependent hydrolase (beta-lactamase superfamily II)
VLSIAIACASLFACSEGFAAAPPAWSAYAIRYATLPAFPVSALVAGADTTRTLDIAMMFWLLQGPGGHRVLVDAGFYRRKFLDSWKIADYVRPSEALQRFGVSPDSVTDVIISHVHWDHLDGADLFPNARLWIQRAEYEHHVLDGTPADAAIDSVDAAMLSSLRKAGRVKLVEGDAQEILPGIVAYTGGKHTFASQYVSVRLAKARAVIASDNMYLDENLDKHVPIAATLDAKSNLAAQDRMEKLASAPRLIVPGHDPAVFQRFHGPSRRCEDRVATRFTRGWGCTPRRARRARVLSDVGRKRGSIVIAAMSPREHPVLHDDRPRFEALARALDTGLISSTAANRHVRVPGRPGPRRHGAARGVLAHVALVVRPRSS